MRFELRAPRLAHPEGRLAGAACGLGVASALARAALSTELAARPLLAAAADLLAAGCLAVAAGAALLGWLRAPWTSPSFEIFAEHLEVPRRPGCSRRTRLELRDLCRVGLSGRGPFRRLELRSRVGGTVLLSLRSFAEAGAAERAVEELRWRIAALPEAPGDPRAPSWHAGRESAGGGQP